MTCPGGPRPSGSRSCCSSPWSACVVLPLLAVIVYLIVRGGEMHERAARQAMARDQAAREYAQQHAGAGSSASSADQLSKLAGLRDRGVISAEECDREKAKVLA